jgi:hypothetical protein
MQVFENKGAILHGKDAWRICKMLGGGTPPTNLHEY